MVPFLRFPLARVAIPKLAPQLIERRGVEGVQGGKRVRYNFYGMHVSSLRKGLKPEESSISNVVREGKRQGEKGGGGKKKLMGGGGCEEDLISHRSCMCLSRRSGDRDVC